MQLDIKIELSRAVTKAGRHKSRVIYLLHGLDNAGAILGDVLTTFASCDSWRSQDNLVIQVAAVFIINRSPRRLIPLQSSVMSFPESSIQQ